MKLKYALFFVLIFNSCTNNKKPNFYSFQNKWGVVCFFDPSHSLNRQRMVFLPLKHPVDSNSITEKSSIFDFKYNAGMDFDYHGKNDLNYKVYWISNHTEHLTEQGDTAARIYWAFVKLKYHKAAGKKAHLNIFKYVLLNTNRTDQLKIQSYSFGSSIVIDTAFFKKKWIAPFIDTVKMNRMGGKGPIPPPIYELAEEIVH